MVLHLAEVGLVRAGLEDRGVYVRVEHPVSTICGLRLADASASVDAQASETLRPERRESCGDCLAGIPRVLRERGEAPHLYEGRGVEPHLVPVTLPGVAVGS